MISDEEVPDLLPINDSFAEKVPITIITGFLGSGKTTLINHLLLQAYETKQKIAVVLNDYGEGSALESSLFSICDKDGNKMYENWLELKNGCICCSLKDASVLAIEKMLKEKGHFDYILLETTGLADPGPIASMFWLDESLESSVYLDGIVTLVDAKYLRNNFSSSLDESKQNECMRQIALADVLILNKIDLVDEDQIVECTDLLISINSTANLIKTSRSLVDINSVLKLNMFSSLIVNSVNKDSQVPLRFMNGIGSHDLKVGTITLEWSPDKLMAKDKFENFLFELLWNKSVFNQKLATSIVVLRLKGLIRFSNGDLYGLQCVRELFELTKIENKYKSFSLNQENSRLIFIGEYLDKDILNNYINKCFI